MAGHAAGLMTVFPRLLAFFARYGTQGFIASIALGLAWPQLAAVARPFLGVCIFSFLLLTFMRADLGAVRRVLARPVRLGLACLWLLLAPALIIGVPLALAGRASLDPGLVLGLALMGAAPPMLSGPAVAVLLGLEPTLLLSATVITTVMAPLVSPILADRIAGAGVPLDPAALALRLAMLIGGALACAMALRRLFGEARLAHHRPSFDGGAVVLYLVFAVAAMDGVAQAALSRPGLVAGFTAAAFAVGILGMAAAWAALALIRPNERFGLAYATGHRNMGLLIAALGAGVPDTTYLFFALAQFPIYLMPQLVKPLARRVAGAGTQVAGP